METEVDLVLDTMKEEVAKLIFDVCNIEKNGVVTTSSLIERIRIYFNEISELDVLRNMLDPEGIDVAVTRDSFFENFKEWVQKQNAEHSSANPSSKNSPGKSVSPLTYNLNISNSSPNQSISKTPLKMQKPRKKIRQQLQFSSPYPKREGDFLDVSNDSINNANSNDTTIESLEEKITEYQFENVKSSSEIAELQIQLVTSEETITTLQKDLDQALHKLRIEKQNCDELQKNIDVLRETENNKKQEIEKLEAYTVKLQKENKRLSDKVIEITSEKQNLTGCFEENRGKIVELNKKLVKARDLERELNLTLTEQQKTLDEITTKYKELEQTIEDYVNIIKHLQNENEMLRDGKNYDSFKEIYRDIDEFSPINEESVSLSEDIPDYASIRKENQTMLLMLQCPLSPIAETSTESLSFTSTPEFNRKITSSVISMTSDRKDEQRLPGTGSSLSLNFLVSPHNHNFSTLEVDETSYSDTTAGATLAKQSNLQTCQPLSTELAETSNRSQYSRLPNYNQQSAAPFTPENGEFNNDLSAVSKPRSYNVRSQKRHDDKFVQDLVNRVAPPVESKLRHGTSLDSYLSRSRRFRNGVKASFKAVADKQMRNSKSIVQKLICFFFQVIFLLILMVLVFLLYASLYQRIYLNDRNIRVVPWAWTTWDELYAFLEYYKIITIVRVNPPI